MPVAVPAHIKAVARHGWSVQSPNSPPPAPDTVSSTPGSRDPFFQPFITNSIWNMPLGTGAIWKDAHMVGNPDTDNPFAKMPGFDGEKIVIKCTSPRMAILDCTVGWSGGNRCVATGATHTAVPCPNNFVQANNTLNNCFAGFLSDSRTIVQCQPWTRCTVGGSATALPSTFRADDLYGTGYYGCHGGSGLSAIGGSLRLGELRPGDTEGPHHVLKLNIYCRQFMFRSTNAAQLFRWPATKCDGYATSSRANGGYGTDPTGTGTDGSCSFTDMKMGCLLGFSQGVNLTALSFSTTPGYLLAWTLQNYGGYVVDDTFAAGFDFNGENGPDGSFGAQFASDWGFAFVHNESDTTTSPWVRDIQKICNNLSVVTNNSAGAIGGGGTPLQPLAPEIFPP